MIKVPVFKVVVEKGTLIIFSLYSKNLLKLLNKWLHLISVY